LLQFEYASSISGDRSNIGLSHHFLFQSYNSFESASKSKNSEYNSKSLASNSELVHLLGSKKHSEDIIFLWLVKRSFNCLIKSSKNGIAIAIRKYVFGQLITIFTRFC